MKHTGHFRHPSVSQGKSHLDDLPNTLSYGKSEAISHSEVTVIPRNHKAEEPKVPAAPAVPPLPEVSSVLESESEPEYQIQYVYPNGEIAKDYNPEAAQHGKLQEAYKDLANYGYQVPEGDDGKQQYVYLQQEEAAEESQKSTVSTKLQNFYTDEKQTNVKTSLKGDYENLKGTGQLPVDVNLIKSNVEEVVDVSLIKPIEVNVNRNQFDQTKQESIAAVPETNFQPSQELSSEELNKFLQEYYATTPASKPILETQTEMGFTPIRNKPSPVISESSSPYTFRTNKRPPTSPGLGRYSSQHGYQGINKYSPTYTKFNYKTQGVPQGYNSGKLALYRSPSNNGYLRYAKHISYED